MTLSLSRNWTGRPRPPRPTGPTVAAWPSNPVTDTKPESAAAPTDNVVRRLVLRLQDGDASALEPLIRETQQQAFRTVYAVLQDRQLTEDVLQDAYMTVFQKIGQLREVDAFRGWFRRILVHRAQKELKTRPAEWLDDENRPELRDPSQEDQAVRDRADIRQAFSQMKESERTVLALREVADLSYEDIARTLDVPLTTVKMRIFKARKRFLDFFQGGSR